MTTLSLKTDFPASPQAVWAIAGKFGGLAEWHPWVPACVLSDDGRTRTIPLGGLSAIEVLESEGPGTFTYRVDQSPMPVRDYRCTWTVTPSAGGATLAIEARFEPSGAPEAQAVAMLTGFFEAAFAALRTRVA